MADRNKNLESQNLQRDKNVEKDLGLGQQNLGQQGQGLNKDINRDINKNIPSQTGENVRQPGIQGQQAQTGQQGQQGFDQQKKY